MKLFRALKTFTSLLILSFLFAHVSGGSFLIDLEKRLELLPEIKILPSLTETIATESKLDKALPIKELKDIKKYLELLGYMADSKDDESALVKFQKFFNLTATGEFDKNTYNILTKPRCGVADIVNETTTFKPWWRSKELKYGFYPKNKVMDDFKPLFQDAFNRWSNVTGLSFTEAMNYTHLDIAIVFFPLNGKGRIVGVADIINSHHVGFMFFNSKEQWGLPSKSVVKQDDVDLESVVMHQIGHLLGLEHSSVKESIMYPIVSPEKKIELVNDDELQKIQQIYGVKKVTNVKNNDASDSSWPVVFWPLGFLGFVCFLGLLGN